MPIDWYLSKYPNAKATTGKSARVAVSNYAKEKWRAGETHVLLQHMWKIKKILLSSMEKNLEHGT